MDLYEALKVGTSADELLIKFKKELAAAKEKIEEEKKKESIKKEKEANIAWYRQEVANALVEYTYAFLEQEPSEEEIDETQAIVIKALLEFEKEMERYMETDKALRGFFKVKSKENTYAPKKCSKDSEIINDFIKNAFK